MSKRFRQAYNNGYNTGRVRIDTRPQSDPAVAAGMRNIHRGMRGEIISARTAEGETLHGAPPASRLGNPSTPGLDRWAAMNPSKDGETPKQAELRKRKEVAINGGFGKGAQARAKAMAPKPVMPPSQTQRIASKFRLPQEMPEAGAPAVPRPMATAPAMAKSTPAPTPPKPVTPAPAATPVVAPPQAKVDPVKRAGFRSAMAWQGA